ncbi:zinc finger CCCH domain-containing protein 66-like [Rhodamnia argentea]|uniref:Zinc finger CCCH domain-containing protein 66-like n=1 Tax=Rhodamnia argentea TaxID=178133 RepID=A0A8B8NNP3_9MYRT|nr:zinc finger CCCH domain-containing protein 66-like [Rhodamnia argentea]
MCSGSKGKPTPGSSVGESEFEKQRMSSSQFSVLLELSAADDLTNFRRAVEEDGHDVNESSLWYGRRIGSKKMELEERTPLMIAAMFGSMSVLDYIVKSGRADVNKACGSDGATALHCAAAGGSVRSAEVVKLLLNSSANANSVDTSGKRAGDLIPEVSGSPFNSRRKGLDVRLTGGGTGEFVEETYILPENLGSQIEGNEQKESPTARASKDGSEKKEYPVDLSLPDINNGIYSTDEFRMYSFKVKPCSRAYSHDWTECPFVHPGENARRRDPRKYHYSCVPCPEFRKGSCRHGDNCEYAHGIFECWLHPAQYRTRLCKDEIGCTRKVCFFAHKPEELRPLYASTGSALPSPRSFSPVASSLDMGSISPLSLGSSVRMPPTSTPPMTPSGASSPLGGSMWKSQINSTPPGLQLPGSRLRSALSARDMDLDVDLIGLENNHRLQQQLLERFSDLSSPCGWNNSLSTTSAFPEYSGDMTGEISRLGGAKPNNLEDGFRSFDSTLLPQLQGLSLDGAVSQLQSPTGMKIRQNMTQQLYSSYTDKLSSSPRALPSFGTDPSRASAAATLSSRSLAFAKRSHSFIERSTVNCQSGYSSSVVSPTARMPSHNDWGSPDGKLDWGIQGEELNKLRKSASFGLRSSGNRFPAPADSATATLGEPDVPWIQSLVKEGPSQNPGNFGAEQQQQQQYHLSSGGTELLPAWVEQLYVDQEQMVA